MFDVLALRRELENYGFRIAFTGRMGTGKSSVADFLVKSFGFKRYSFAAKLKEIASDLFGMNTKDRLLLQTLGTKIREVEQDSWANFVVKQIEAETPLRATIDDMRYLNEARILKENGFTLVRLYADTRIRKDRKIVGFNPETDMHPSETETDRIEVDYALDTSGSLDLCYRKIMELLQELSKIEQNPT
jgi:dephospho-CoA kinase